MLQIRKSLWTWKHLKSVMSQSCDKKCLTDGSAKHFWNSAICRENFDAIPFEQSYAKYCKSLLCSLFNEQTCSRFTWLFVRVVVTMPKISLKTLYCYIFEKPKVQGHQNWYSQLSNTQIHKYKYKYTNTALLKCQEYQTYAIFLNSCWFKDVKNDIPKCLKWSDPTTDPTTDPTNDLTSDPISDPTSGPTSDPTSDPIYVAKNSNSKGIQSWYLKFSTHCVILHL